MPAKTKSDTERIYSNECHGKTFHRLVTTAKDDGTDDDMGFWWSTLFEMFQCRGCQEVVLRRTFRFSENSEEDVRYFPPAMSRYLPEWRSELPRDMRALLEEIYRSLDGANVRLPMMGARALLDMLMLEKVGDIGGFQQKLDALEKAGFVSKENRKVLDAALDVGSAASHRGHMPSDSEVQAVLDIIENTLQAVYVFPDVEKELRKSTPPRPPKKPAAGALPAVTPVSGKSKKFK